MSSNHKIYKSKIYNNFGVFLKRKKIDKNHAIAKLLLEKFAFSKRREDWKCIRADELKILGILEKDESFSSWRTKMIKNRVLICMASKDELGEKSPNHKANMFKAGDSVQKYIDLAIKESMPQRMEKVEDRVDSVENKVEKLQKDVQALTELVLMAIPPDTPERRKIVEENFSNKENCMKLLNTQFN